MRKLIILYMTFVLLFIGCKNIKNPYEQPIDEIINPPVDPPIDPPALIVSCSVSDDDGEVPFDVSFIGNVTEGTAPYSFSWDFGDGNTSDLQNPPHVYYKTGDHDVMFTVTDSKNVQASSSVPVHVYSKYRTKVTVSACTNLSNHVWKAKLYLDGESFNWADDPSFFQWHVNPDSYSKESILYPGEHKVTVLFWHWSPFEVDPPDDAYFKINVFFGDDFFSYITFGYELEDQFHNDAEILPHQIDTGWFQWKAGDIKELIFTIVEK